MPGTREGYQKWRTTMIEKLGSVEAFNQWRARNSAKGGKNANPDNPGNFRNNRKLAKRAGRTKRTSQDQPPKVQRQQYKNERDDMLHHNDTGRRMGAEIAKTLEGVDDKA